MALLCLDQTMKRVDRAKAQNFHLERSSDCMHPPFSAILQSLLPARQAWQAVQLQEQASTSEVATCAFMHIAR